MSDTSPAASPSSPTTTGWLTGLAVTAAAGAVVAGAGAAYGALIERNRFEVRHETVACLPAGSSPVRVLHLADIHMSLGQKRKTDWLRSLASLRPDLVVNTGDNLSHVKAIRPLLDALGPLMEFPGVFVPGSNDYFAPVPKNPAVYLLGPTKLKDGQTARQPKKLDTEKMHAGFGAAGWVNLTNRNQSVVMHRIRFDFTGVDDPHMERDRFAGWPAGSKYQTRAPHVRIAVTHAPYQRVLDRFTAAGADLILAGHTHGGQVCVPGYGALISNCDLPTWRARGLTDWEYDGHSTPLNVSAGIGTSRFAPVRFACPPEAVLLTLTARGA
ncbi:metallophosphoesterase [Paenarthrobacter sp. Z7-10]|uniref:metallophosphoesterase n=1 Tax=Paenarthrobacter sp. Z7-10 TaxID=2787635 RepID=UPI0022A9071F|nr:metallophosphoesterase [Paenarthrobacter sp. Z7-10]MCZ2401819.1 metallophosphoesterase [Paenarthrobacter sp. Z7-10]